MLGLTVNSSLSILHIIANLIYLKYSSHCPLPSQQKEKSNSYNPFPDLVQSLNSLAYFSQSAVVFLIIPSVPLVITICS